MKLTIGQKVPEFRLTSHLGESISIRDFEGKNVVIAFFPRAWTPI
jgi:peroxiredoxin Q/BCP